MNTGDLVQSLEAGAAAFPRRADRWFHLAVALAHAEEPEGALAALDRALGINPHYAEAAILRCFTLAERGKVGEAFREFRILFARSPEDFGVVFPLGVFCMRQGWSQSGLSLLLKAEALRPRLPLVLAHSAAALEVAGDREARAQRVRRASEVLEGLGLDVIGGAEGGVEARVADCLRWTNPVLARLALLRSDRLRQTGDIDGAEEELRRGNATYPGHAALLVGLGALLVARARNEEAERWLGAAVSMDADCHEAWFELSFLHAEKGDLEGARAALRRAVSLRPLFPDYRYQLGILLRDLGRLREAIVELSRVHLLNPHSGFCSLHLAEAQLESGDVEGALLALEEGRPSDIPEALIVAARIHLSCGAEDETRKLLENVLGTGISHEDALVALDALRAPTAKPPGTSA